MTKEDFENAKFFINEIDTYNFYMKKINGLIMSKHIIIADQQNSENTFELKDKILYENGIKNQMLEILYKYYKNLKDKYENELSKL